MASFELHPVALVLAILLAAHGVRKGSLSRSGGLAAGLVGYAHLACPNPIFGVLLLAFFFSGSRATKVKASVKAKLERELDQEKHKAAAGGQRSAIQVLCNSLPAALAALVYRLLFSTETGLQNNAVRKALLSKTKQAVATTPLPCSALLSTVAAQSQRVQLARTCILLAVGHYACCEGDVLASELGILSRTPPRLITTGRTVPPGTNGGVSAVGTAWSAAGGAFIGLVAFVGDVLLGCGMSQAGVASAGLRLVLLGAAAGLVGSGLDSLMGATLQRTWYSKRTKQVLVGGRPPQASEKEWEIITGAGVLSNNSVNFISAASTAVITAGIGSLVL